MSDVQAAVLMMVWAAAGGALAWVSGVALRSGPRVAIASGWLATVAVCVLVMTRYTADVRAVAWRAANVMVAGLGVIVVLSLMWAVYFAPDVRPWPVKPKPRKVQPPPAKPGNVSPAAAAPFAEGEW